MQGLIQTLTRADRRGRFLAAVICALGIAGVGGACAQPVDEVAPETRIDVAYLSSDLLEGRETGTRGEALAAEYIAARFEEIGLEPAARTDGWFQPFSFTYSSNPHASAGEGEQRQGRNVVGVLDYGAERTVVIGAHFDHLGYGGMGSLSPGDSLIHNGADDNASGVAALLSIAARLRESGATSNNYIFAAFSGEELGLYGSKEFVDDPPVPLDQINYMINLDMVGRLGSDRALAVNGTGTAPAWDAAIDASAEAHDLDVNKHESGLGPSDHASFYLRDIPVLHLFTGQHAEYHKPGDDSQLIDYAGIEDVAAFTVEVIEALDGEGKLEFTPTKDESQARASFKVTLGVMPDYVSDVEGMRIDAVLDDRPAARAGLKDGDVIVRLGDVEVGGMEDYMEALSKFEAGDTTTVVVRRGDEVIEREVTF